MGQKAETEVAIERFQGMASNIDPRELNPGVSQIQINVAVLKIGELVLRRGFKELQFDADDF